MRIFNETQRFTQWPIQLIKIGSITFLVYYLYQWFIVNESTGNVTSNNLAGQIFILTSIAVVLLLFYFMKLKTSLDEIGIHYRFLPFHLQKNTIRWNAIEKCYTRKYNPIGEFGGWGLRGGFGNNRAYNVRGNQGIQLELKNGKKLLIGTQKKEAAEQVVRRYFKTENE